MDNIRTISDCPETPKFWDDDAKMTAWFAPFRSRDLNPLNYDNKMAFWKNNVDLFCDKTRKVYVSLNDVKSFFVRNGKHPNCLSLVFQNLLNEGIIQLSSDYEKSLSNNSWSGWALNTFVESPIRWSYQRFMGSVNPPTIEIDENAEFVHITSLKKQSQHLLKCVTDQLKGNIVTYSDLRTLLAEKEGINFDQKTVELIVKFLECERKAHVVFDNHCNVSLIKFACDSQPVIPITDSEVSVFVLQTKEKKLIAELEKLENEKERLHNEVKELLFKKMRNMAKNTLRKQKELEKRIDKHMNVLENIQNLLYRVQDTEASSEILKSYKIGTDAIKSEFAKKGLSLENVDQTMEELEFTKDTLNDIEETLGRAIGNPADEAELESELAELLLDDAPSVPPEYPSPGRKTYDTTTEESRAAMKGSDFGSSVPMSM